VGRDDEVARLEQLQHRCDRRHSRARHDRGGTAFELGERAGEL
jgi:hypothetical protein